MPPLTWEFGSDLASLPDGPAVYLVHLKQGPPYLGRTSVLRRRVARMIKRMKLDEIGVTVEYWLSGSRLERALTSLELGRKYYPNSYHKLLNLRFPPYLRLTLSNEFPRSQVTARLGGGQSLYYGPFRSRATADLFESQFLDLFQMRRCQEDLAPSPEHPGCIYGEMNMCLRPCQEVVGKEGYRTEVDRVVHFLSSNGASLIDSIASARERLSAGMEFEEAARQHKRLERVDAVLKVRDPLVRDADRLNGVAVAPSLEPAAVDLFVMLGGVWQGKRTFTLATPDGRPVSLDKRLREMLEALSPAKVTITERQDHIAVLARWYYSSWCDGDWIGFDDRAKVAYRRVVAAIHRMAKS